MKIAYIDLNPIDYYEDYSINPQRYGGGRVFASWFKQFPEFFIFAATETFSSLSENDRKTNCIPITTEARQAIWRGEPVANHIPYANSFDLFVHLHPEISLNLTGLKSKELLWLAGYDQHVNSKVEHIAIYNNFQKPVILGDSKSPKIYYFQLGYPIRPFKENQKEDFGESV